MRNQYLDELNKRFNNNDKDIINYLVEENTRLRKTNYRNLDILTKLNNSIPGKLLLKKHGYEFEELKGDTYSGYATNIYIK